MIPRNQSFFQTALAQITIAIEAKTETPEKKVTLLLTHAEAAYADVTSLIESNLLAVNYSEIQTLYQMVRKACFAVIDLDPSKLLDVVALLCKKRLEQDSKGRFYYTTDSLDQYYINLKCIVADINLTSSPEKNIHRYKLYDLITECGFKMLTLGKTSHAFTVLKNAYNYYCLLYRENKTSLLYERIQKLSHSLKSISEAHYLQHLSASAGVPIPENYELFGISQKELDTLEQEQNFDMSSSEPVPKKKPEIKKACSNKEMTERKVHKTNSAPLLFSKPTPIAPPANTAAPRKSFCVKTKKNMQHFFSNHAPRIIYHALYSQQERNKHTLVTKTLSRKL